MLKSSIHIVRRDGHPPRNAAQPPMRSLRNPFTRNTSIVLIWTAVLLWCALAPPPVSSSEAPPLDGKLNRILKDTLPKDFAITIQAVDLGTGRRIVLKRIRISPWFPLPP